MAKGQLLSAELSTRAFARGQLLQSSILSADLVETRGQLLQSSLTTEDTTVPAPTVNIQVQETLLGTVITAAGTSPNSSQEWAWGMDGVGRIDETGPIVQVVIPPSKTDTVRTFTVTYRSSGIWSNPTTRSITIPKHEWWAGEGGAIVPIWPRDYSDGPTDPGPDPDNGPGIPVPAAQRELAEMVTSEDTPTFAYQALASTAAPTLRGSVGWYREKRVGVAEAAPGAAQAATGALDLTGSSYFRYPGVPAAAAYSGGLGHYVSTGFKPGGTSQNAYWLFSVEFIAVNTDEVQIRLNAPVANPRLGLVLVNGRRVSDRAIQASGISAGAGYVATLKFPTVGTRTIKIYGLGHNQGRFGGVAVPAGGSISKPPHAPTTRVAIIGDSFTNGAGAHPDGANSVETFAWDLARMLGSQETMQAGIGSTGFVTPLGSDAESLYSGRIPAVRAMNPSHVLIVGGRNDGNKAGIAAAVREMVDAFPNAQVWLISNNVSVAGHAAIEGVAESYGSRIWWSPIQDVAASVQLGSDGVHPTFAGHRTFANLAWARRSGAQVVAARGQLLHSAIEAAAPLPPVVDDGTLAPATGTPSEGLFFERPTAQQIAAGPTPDRMGLAHYYAPQPGAFSNAATDFYESGYLPVNGEGGAHAAFGGWLRDRPMLGAPFATSPSWQRNMQAAEIRAAVQAGIDGFYCNIMGSSGSNWDRYVWMADEASINFPGFKVVPMVDANGNMAQTEAASVAAARINTLLSKACAWRLPDGRYVVGTFKMEGRPLTYWNEVKTILANTHGKQTAFVGVYNNINQAANYAGIQYGTGQWGPGADPNIYANLSNLGTGIKARNERYLIGAWAQDIRPRSDLFDEARNTEAIRAALDAMIRQNADLAQYCTWSDHTEGSQIRPTVMRGHAILDIMAYRIARWKTGKRPRILRDAVYLSHRNQMANATITGGQTRFMQHWVRNNRSAFRESVEILSYLTAPATVTVKVGSNVVTYTAPAGEHQHLVPMQPGEVSVKVVRSGAEVARVNSPVVIKSTTVNQDRQYAVFSSVRGTAGQYDPTPGSPQPNPANYIT